MTAQRISVSVGENPGLGPATAVDRPLRITGALHRNYWKPVNEAFVPYTQLASARAPSPLSSLLYRCTHRRAAPARLVPDRGWVNGQQITNRLLRSRARTCLVAAQACPRP